MRNVGKLLRNSRGQMLPGFVIGMFAFLGLSAGAIDIGRHAFTATELQNLADAAASAAAKAAGNSGNALAAAQAISENNRVDGAVHGFTSSDVVVGKYSSGAFTPGGTPSNAVRVTATKTLTNILAGVIGYPTSTITRQATASIVALGGGIATMPIALGESYWQNCIVYGCTLPQLVRVPDTANNAGWTAFNLNTSSTTVRSFIPSTPACIGNEAGGGATAPYITVGSFINLANGQGSQMDTVQCYHCANPATNNFLVPIVRNLGTFNQSAEVVGFATIVIHGYIYSGQGNSVDDTIYFCDNLPTNRALQRVVVNTVINANAPGPPGPGFYGSGFAQVVG